MTMQIRITSRLSANASRRLRRQANVDILNDYQPSFAHCGKNTYTVIEADDFGEYIEYDERLDAHNVARHMMVAAGQTFDYEII